MTASLNKFRLVLIAPQYPINLGAVARLAANFDLQDVVLVSPLCRIDHPDAVKFAKGLSIEYLRRFRTVGSLSEALSDCEFSIAFARKANRPPAQHQSISEVLRSNGRYDLSRRIALVFGREDSGLTNDEISRCGAEVSLRTAEKMPSLNLSHSIGIVLSELFSFSQKESKSEAALDVLDLPATHQELEELTEHLKRLMLDAGMTTGSNPERMLTPIAATFRRAQLTKREMGYYRALFSKTQVALRSRMV